MNTKSRKSKGRRLQQMVRDAIKAYFNLPLDRVRCTLMGEAGPDVTIVGNPYKIECKNTETLNIWQALKQAEGHATLGEDVPILVFKRNHSEVYAVMRFTDLLPLLKVNTYE